MPTAAETYGSDVDPRELAQLQENLPPEPPKPAPVSEKEALSASSEALRRQIATQGEEAALLQEKQAAVEPYREAAQAEIREQQATPVPPLKTPPPVPVPDRSTMIDQTVAKSLFATAAVLSAIGLAGGRSRGMLAMAGLTGAINGFREGNQEKYKAGIEQYRNQIAQQLEQFRMMEEERKSILENRKLNLTQKLQLLDLESRKWDDRLTAVAAQRKDLEGIIKSGGEISKMQAALTKADHDAQLLPLEIGLKKAQIEQAPLREDLLRAQTAAALAAAKAKDNSARDNKRAPPGFYFDKSEGDFVSFPLTEGELRDEPGRYVKLSPQNADLVKYIVSVKAQLPTIRELANEVLPSSGMIPGVGAAGGWLSGVTAPYRPGGVKMQQYKELRQALINEAGNVENRSRGLTKYLRDAMEQQFPTPATDRKVAQGQFDLMEKIIDARLKGILGHTTVGTQGSGGQQIQRSKDKDGRPIYNDGSGWKYE